MPRNMLRRVSVDLTVESVAGNVEIAVRDYGLVLRRTKCPDIPPVLSGQSAITEGVSGTGIGLTIACQLAQRLHGKIQVTAQEPGVRFTLTLPRDENMKILIAGEVMLTSAAVWWMCCLKVLAHCRTISGRAALESYHRDKPDFVLLDIMMPEMDGYTVCREIRRQNEHIPIVFLSAKEIDRVVDEELGRIFINQTVW